MNDLCLQSDYIYSGVRPSQGRGQKSEDKGLGFNWDTLRCNYTPHFDLF